MMLQVRLSAQFLPWSEFKATEKNGSTVEGAEALGELIGKKAQENGITEVVFDRGGNLYHGRIKAAEGARVQA